MVIVRTMVATTTNNNTPVSGFFCVCLPRKFMGLKAKVCFTGDMGLGFGQDLGLGFVFCWRLIIGKNTNNEKKIE